MVPSNLTWYIQTWKFYSFDHMRAHRLRPWIDLHLVSDVGTLLPMTLWLLWSTSTLVRVSCQAGSWLHAWALSHTVLINYYSALWYDTRWDWRLWTRDTATRRKSCFSITCRHNHRRSCVCVMSTLFAGLVLITTSGYARSDHQLSQSCKPIKMHALCMSCR